MAYDYNIDQGLISEDTSDIQTDVETEYKNALNAPNLVTKSSSTQGTLIAAEVLSRQGILKNNVEQANLFNPNYAYGVALDAICSLLGIARGSDAATSVQFVTFNGSSVDNDIVIPSGSRLTTDAGDVFLTSSSITIDKGASSSTTGTIISQSNGAIPAAVGDLTIVDGTIGFASASITSSSVVTLGTEALTDPQLKASRNRRLFAQGVGSIGAIRAHLLAVNNVDSVNVIENVTGQFATAVNGITFTKNYGVWVCVYGAATDADVAAALWKAHGGSPFDMGATGQGTQTTVATTDPYSGIDYTVNYVRAVEKVAYVKATVKRGTSTATSATIIAAMVNYADGGVDGEDGLIVGSDVSAYEFAGAITNVYPGLFVSKVEVAITDAGGAVPSESDYSDIATINPWEIAVASTGTISVSLS